MGEIKGVFDERPTVLVHDGKAAENKTPFDGMNACKEGSRMHPADPGQVWWLHAFRNTRKHAVTQITGPKQTSISHRRARMESKRRTGDPPHVEGLKVSNGNLVQTSR